jgi:hypothetical protein
LCLLALPVAQAVTKYSITAQQQQQPDAASFSIRDVFVARPGYVLLSAGEALSRVSAPWCAGPAGIASIRDRAACFVSICGLGLQNVLQLTSTDVCISNSCLYSTHKGVPSNRPLCLARLLLQLQLLLLPSDYSQVELRMLAHFSGDRLLQQLLSQSGPGVDVFSLIAAAWLQQGRAGAAGAGQQLHMCLHHCMAATAHWKAPRSTQMHAVWKQKTWR